MNKTVKSFTIVTGFSVVTRLLSFVFKIWMSRALGAEIVGLYQIALSVLQMLFTLTAGAPTVLSRKVAEAVTVGNTRRQSALTTASLILGTGVSLTLVTVLVLCRDSLGFLFSDQRCLPIFLIMLPTLFTSTLYASFRSWFWGRKNFLAFSSTELLDEVVRILLSVVFAGGLISTISGAEGIALAMTLSDLLCVVVLAILFFVAGGRLSKPKGFKELLGATIPLSATRIITSLTASLTALIIPQMLVSGGMSVAAATAEYGRVAGMAFPLIMAPVTLIGALSVVLIPDVAELRAKGDLESIRTKLSTAITFAVLVASVFFVLYLPLGKQIGILLFNDETAGTYVSYCSLLLFPIAMSQITTPILNSLGCEKNTFINSLSGAVLIIPCIFLLPKFIGTYAMAAGSGACFTLTAILNVIILKKRLGSFGSLAKSAKTVLFSIPLAILGMLTTRLITPILGNVVTILVSAAYLAFFLFLFISAFDIADFVGYIKLLKPNTSILQRRKNFISSKSKGLKTRKTVSGKTKKRISENSAAETVNFIICDARNGAGKRAKRRPNIEWKIKRAATSSAENGLSKNRRKTLKNA